MKVMHKSYSDGLIEEVLNRSDIVRVVSQHVKLKKTGKNHKGLCPFHKEKTPSFIVSEDRQRFHCFGCGASGDVIEFVMRMEKLDFVDALEFLAEQSGIRLSDYVRERKGSPAARDKSDDFALMKEAAVFFYKNLKQSKRAIAYLKKRGIDGKTAKTFGLGYAPDQWDGLLNHLTKGKGWDLKALERCGLIIARQQGPGFYDRFRNRIMFPIFDIRGRVVGFGGRVLGDEVPKYLNSPETDLFNKRTLLFGLNFAKHHTGSEKRLVMVEGYMDVISLHAGGFKNAVASLGTALTEDQAALLNRYAREVVIAYDSDEAGTKAAAKALDVLAKVPCEVRVLTLSGAKDPDEFVKTRGMEAFEAEVAKALPSMEYRIGRLRNRFDRRAPEERIAYARELKRLLESIEDPIRRQVYLKRIRNEEFEIAELLEKSMTSKTTGNPKGKRPSNRVYTVEANRCLGTERLLIGLILADRTAYGIVRDLVTDKDFRDDVQKTLYGTVAALYERGETPSPERLTDLLELEGVEEWSRIKAMDMENMTAGKSLKTVLYGCLVSMRCNRIENELAGLDKNKLEKEGDLERLKELYSELNRYKKMRGRLDAVTASELAPKS